MSNSGLSASDSYQSFILRNRIRVNRYLNIVLWFFVITGPCLALGVRSGAFHTISYLTGFCVSAVVILMAGGHRFLLKRFPDRRFTSYFALAALNALIVYMVFAHVHIYLTWFLVPLLSILFCDRATYLVALLMNYALMVSSTWLTAPWYAKERPQFGSEKAFFFNLIGGFTIEMLIMSVSGFVLVSLTAKYFQELIRQNELIRVKEQEEEEKLEILDSMAEIYDKVNLIDFADLSEMSLRSSERQKHGIDLHSQTHTFMDQRIRDQVRPDQLEDFLLFTNITTLRSRLEKRKIISRDFIDASSGWFRAQYIVVKADEEGVPERVIYTSRNIDEEKRREEHLIRLSLTDEMTRLHNRRCYEEDLDALRGGPLEEDLVLFSIDVNGLKRINDTKGHAAGDELICAAADCLSESVRRGGKVYRTGGDEFMAIVSTREPERLIREIKERASKWQGSYSKEITMSVGHAAFAEHPDADLDELERIADAAMYEDKEAYYRERGGGRGHA